MRSDDAEARGRRRTFFEAVAARPDDHGRRLKRLGVAEPVPYRILVGHRTVDGRELSDLSLRVQYLHLTDVLIHRIIEVDPDVVVFLDKSARPVAWLVAALWGLSALASPDPVASIPARPAFRFLNIDREQWRDVIDPMGVGWFEVSRVPEEVIIGLRRAFIAGDAHGLADAEVWAAVTMLSGKRILVVDEVAVSGDTLGIARGLIGRAFPDTELDGAHWMRPQLVRRGQNRFNNQVPVWYRDDTVFGRLVGNRDPAMAKQSASWRVRAGAWFLSLPHPIRDVDGLVLRAEIDRLVADVVRGELPLIPSWDRGDVEERIEVYTGYTPVQLRDWREANGIVLGA